MLMASAPVAACLTSYASLRNSVTTSRSLRSSSTNKTCGRAMTLPHGRNGVIRPAREPLSDDQGRTSCVRAAVAESPSQRTVRVEPVLHRADEKARTKCGELVYTRYVNAS